MTNKLNISPQKKFSDIVEKGAEKTMSKNGLSEIDNKIRTRAQEIYGDKTVYSHHEQARFTTGAEFGYSLSLERVGELEKEVAKYKQEVEVITNTWNIHMKHCKSNP